MKKNSEPIRNFNLGNSGEFGSLFGNKSRRKHDNKNYEKLKNSKYIKNN